MFVKNPSSIKRKTVKVQEDAKQYLCKNGHIPISKENNTWVFISSKDVLSILETYQTGGEK